MRRVEAEEQRIRRLEEAGEAGEEVFDPSTSGS